MGTLDLPHDKLKVATGREGAHVLIVASQGQIDAFTETSGESVGKHVNVASLAQDAGIPIGMLDNVGLLIIEVDPNSRASMDRVKTIRDAWPELLIVAAIKDATVSLIRTLVHEGVSDVVALPFDADEVLEISRDTISRRYESKSKSTNDAPLIAVVRSIGGCGATSIATHLAADLGAQDSGGKGAVIVDLDMQFGSIADYLGVSPRGSFLDLVAAGERLDEELLTSVTADLGHGLSAIVAPDVIMPLEEVDTQNLLSVIKLLRRQFEYVILDLPADWTNWALSAVMASDVILMVVELTLPSLRQAKRRLNLFRSVGIENRSIEIVVNRVEKRLFGTISFPDVETTLGHSVLGSIALERPLVSTAQDQNLLVSAVKRNSRFVKDVAKIGELLRAGQLSREQ